MPDSIEVPTAVRQQVALCVGPSGEVQVWCNPLIWKIPGLLRSSREDTAAPEVTVIYA